MAVILYKDKEESSGNSEFEFTFQQADSRGKCDKANLSIPMERAFLVDLK
jgi:hypothetical protein